MCPKFIYNKSLFLHSRPIPFRNPLTTCIPYLLIEPYKSLYIHPRASMHKYIYKQSTQTVATLDDVIPQQIMQRIFGRITQQRPFKSINARVGKGLLSRTWRVPAAQRPPASNKLNYFHNSHLFIRPKRKCKKKIFVKISYTPSLY